MHSKEEYMAQGLVEILKIVSLTWLENYFQKSLSLKWIVITRAQLLY